MPFQPGQSGNPKGTQREKKFAAALERAIKQDDAKRLREAAEKLLDLAAAGEAWAVKELADRLDGRAAQSVEHSGEIELNSFAVPLTQATKEAPEWERRTVQ